MNDGLPTGTVTFLLADAEGSTWETQPGAMTAAAARLDEIFVAAIGTHGGARPAGQGEFDGFVAAFMRASDAVACALELQRAALAPTSLRIGIHTGEAQLRDDGNYNNGPTINRAVRLRDLAYCGQTVLSGSTYELVVDNLPADAWLTDLGTHRLRDLPRSERVVQLCHPGLCNNFPPLRGFETSVAQHLPVYITSFVGRAWEFDELRRVIDANGLVTLTGPGGVGKTRLAIELAYQIGADFPSGTWYVDLAPITDGDVVPVAAIRALHLPDQPGRSAIDTLVSFVGDRQMLFVVDNCEHLLDATAALLSPLLSACPRIKLLATSREPIAVAGEVTWRVPSLSLAGDAIELFADRARLVRPEFGLTEESAATVTEICRRLDGIPLAIELAAARVRAMSLNDVLDGLRDRFRLLTGGTRTAVQRQQTLRASVDWSHSLLTAPERILFRRLSAFLGGFDLDAAQAVAAAGDIEGYQVLDQLTLLVDKSLVVAEEGRRAARYRLLETVRQYALEKLGESGEADDTRTRHRDYYLARAALIDRTARLDHDQLVDSVEAEIDNLRAAFTWSLENTHIDHAMRLTTALQPLWLARGRLQEGLAWYRAAFDERDAHQTTLTPATHSQALADRAMLHVWTVGTFATEEAEQALAIARELRDPAVLAHALAATGFVATYRHASPESNLTEAIALARELGDARRLGQILGWRAYAGFLDGDPATARAAGEEGRAHAQAAGDGFTSRFCDNWGINTSLAMQGDLDSAAQVCAAVIADAEAAADRLNKFLGLLHMSHVLAYQGATEASRNAALAAIEVSDELGGAIPGIGYLALAISALAAGDIPRAAEANVAAGRQAGTQPEMSAIQLWRRAETELALGHVTEARCCADNAVDETAGWHRMAALTTRARVALAQALPEQAERDARLALAIASENNAVLFVPDTLECLAQLTADAGGGRDAARLLGAADAIRRRMHAVRFKVHDGDVGASASALRNVMGPSNFDSAFAAGAALSVDEAIAYALRGRGERKRPSSGWAALTPTELDVVRLVGDGLGNKDIASKLFMSHRTVQTHLTHVYAKLDLKSRVQLAQESARHR